jgi:hypothetical protein
VKTLGKLFFDDQPIVVSKELAKLVGLNEAIVLQQVHYWLEINRKADKNFRDGKYWSYNSIKNWHEKDFPYWSYNTVKRTFSKLVKQDLLLVGNYNKLPGDKTNWYTINEEAIDKLKSSKHKTTESVENTTGPKWANGHKTAESVENTTGPKWANPLAQNEPSPWPKMGQALPEITTETNKENLSINQGHKNKPSYNEPGDESKEMDRMDGLTSPKKEKLPSPTTKKAICNQNDYTHYKAIIANNIEHDHLKEIHPNEGMIDDILLLLVDVMVSNKKAERINSALVPIEVVRSQIMKLRSKHIEYVVESMRENTSKAKNIRAYLLTALYNAPQTINSYYTNKVNHDLSK